MVSVTSHVGSCGLEYRLLHVPESLRSSEEHRVHQSRILNWVEGAWQLFRMFGLPHTWRSGTREPLSCRIHCCMDSMPPLHPL